VAFGPNAALRLINPGLLAVGVVLAAHVRAHGNWVLPWRWNPGVSRRNRIAANKCGGASLWGRCPLG